MEDELWGYMKGTVGSMMKNNKILGKAVEMEKGLKIGLKYIYDGRNETAVDSQNPGMD